MGGSFKNSALGDRFSLEKYSSMISSTRRQCSS